LLFAACATPPTPLGTPTGTTTTGAFQVVALGDSFASGQGAPDKPFKWWKFLSTPAWDDKRCNRSLNAPTAQAVESLKQQGHSVGLASFACSGATIEEGLIGPHQGPEAPVGASPLPPQVDALTVFAASSPVHAVTISIGGNDISFQNIVIGCMLGDCTQFEPLIEVKLQLLDDWLDALAPKLAAIASIDAERILLLEYPDPTQDSDGSPCDREPPGDPLSGIGKVQAEWAGDFVLPRLNHELCQAAKRHGWTYVTGIQPKVHEHGYCATPNWINTINQSLERQRHYRGGMHPNETGHGKTGERVEEVLASMIGGTTPPTPAVCPGLPASP
jgi:lysophospholipase L1-like esterase